MSRVPRLKCRASGGALHKLVQYGNILRPAGNLWEVTLYRPPPQLRVCFVPERGGGRTMVVGLRLPEELVFEGEQEAPWDLVGMWQPCPRCGAVLAWDEAGRVPGARKCLGVEAHEILLDARGYARLVEEDSRGVEGS